MNVLEQFDKFSHVITPAAWGYTGGGIVNAWISIASIHTHHATLTDAFLQISLAAISSIPAVIGGVTLAGGMWLKHVRTVANDERDFRVKMLEKGVHLASENPNRFAPDPRCAKPDEDTEDIK